MRSGGDHQRQIAPNGSSHSQHGSKLRSRNGQMAEQTRRELPFAGARTRAKAPALQVSEIRAALSFNVFCLLQPILHSATSDIPCAHEALSYACNRRMGKCGCTGMHLLKMAHHLRLRPVNVTTPGCALSWRQATSQPGPARASSLDTTVTYTSCIFHVLRRC